MTPALVQAAAASVVVGALLFARSSLRARAGGAAAPEIEVRSRHALGRDSGLAVVSWNGRALLVGYAQSGVTLLRDAPAEVVEP